MDLADVTRIIMAYLSDEAVGALMRSGAVTYSAEMFRDQHWWHERVETLSGRLISYDDREDWKEVYQILKRELAMGTPSFWNGEDNATVDKVLLAMGYDPNVDAEAPVKSAKTGAVNILAFLLSESDLDPNLREGRQTLIMLAAREARLEVVKLLLSDLRTRPNSGTMTSGPLIEACRTIHQDRLDAYIEIVKLLLSDGRCDPRWNHSICLRVTSELRDNDEIVRLLLADGRADPIESLAIIAASKLGRERTVALLLADGRTDPNIQDGTALLVAVYGSHNTVVKLLLSDDRTYAAINGNAALEAAIEESNLEVIELLLSDEEVAAALTDETLTLVEEIGDPEVIDLIRARLDHD